MIEGVPLICSVLNSFMHDIFLFPCHYKIFQFCCCFIRYVRRIHFVSLFCVLLKRHEQVLSFHSICLRTIYHTGHWQSFCAVSQCLFFPVNLHLQCCLAVLLLRSMPANSDYWVFPKFHTIKQILEKMAISQRFCSRPFWIGNLGTSIYFYWH